jgi:hypothetical protein
MTQADVASLYNAGSAGSAFLLIGIRITTAYPIAWIADLFYGTPGVRMQPSNKPDATEIRLPITKMIAPPRDHHIVRER